MQGLTRLVQVQGRALSGSVLQHLRVEGSAFSSTIQARKESGQPSKDSLEEHGFERSTIADILKEKGQKADGSWLWCTVDETVYDAVKHMTSHNVGALLVVKPGEAKALAGIITERGEFLESLYQTLCEFTF
jgi:CBS domain-containing protein